MGILSEIRKHTQRWTCEACNRINPASNPFCEFCGEPRGDEKSTMGVRFVDGKRIEETDRRAEKRAERQAEKRPPAPACPNCRKILPRTAIGARYCPFCGKPLAGEPGPEPANERVFVPKTEMVICRQCGEKNPAGQAFCDFCGGMTRRTPKAPAQQPAAPEKAPAPRSEAHASRQESGPAMPRERERRDEFVPKKASLTCPECGASNPPGESFCNECGCSLSQAPNRSNSPAQQR